MNSNISDISKFDELYLCSLFNSYLFDYSLRQRVTTNITMFYIYQLPVPRLSEINPNLQQDNLPRPSGEGMRVREKNTTGQEKKTFDSLVERAAKLICTTEEFADLWKDVMGTPISKTPSTTRNSPNTNSPLPYSPRLV